MPEALTGLPEPVGPHVSVMIPTYNRKESLLCTLDSLSQQTLPARHFEVVVVDDGGSDGTDQAVQQTAFPFKLVYLQQTNQGSAAARNYGAQMSRGDVLVFIDDDITLCPEFLAELTAKTQPGTITMGLWLPYKPPKAAPFCKDYGRQVAERAARTLHDEEVAYTECTSNNLAVHRSDFVHVGQWQDVLGDGPTLWGDVEFGYRAWQHGCHFVRAANARAVHRDYHITNLSVACQRAYHVAYIVQPLFQRHPEIQRHLGMFRHKEPINRNHDSSTLIIRKIALQVAWSRPALWAVKKMTTSLERLAPDSRLLALLYRWVISGEIFRGYRHGLIAVPKGRKAWPSPEKLA